MRRCGSVAGLDWDATGKTATIAGAPRHDDDVYELLRAYGDALTRLRLVSRVPSEESEAVAEQVEGLRRRLEVLYRTGGAPSAGA
jgi:hypothetical protein